MRRLLFGSAGASARAVAALNAAVAPGDMGLPGLKLHPLKGGRSATWAVSVSGNCLITFRFSGQDAVDADYEDYH